MTNVAPLTRRLDRAALLRSTAIGAVAALAMVTQAAAQPAPNARPQGGQVTAGSAGITNNPNATIIQQSSNRAAIDWRSFDVGRNQSVDFRQPNSGSVTLNRVGGVDPSSIAGRIDANGQIVITNPNGVTFYRGSEVNAQSIVVSAAGISNRNFMAGRMVFDQTPNPNARIDNRGVITVQQTGLAALVAPSVANSGVISARLGRVVLAGASVHTLDMYGDGLVSIDVTKQVRQAPVGPDGRVVTALVTNTGTIAADGGVVQLSATAADGVVQNLVRAGGTIHADTVGGRTGAIEIAGNGGSVVIEGRLSADGTAPGTVGGTIMMAGGTATRIVPSAGITANGSAGGGTIAVGTTLSRARGSGPAPAGTSRSTIVAAGAKISADATVSGNGGRVTVLSTRHTAIGGALTARGGAVSGDGGTVELSGELGFRLTGTADTSAPHGTLGSIVLDPRDLTISTTGGNNIAPTNGVDPNISAGAGGTGTDAFVTPAQLQALTGNIHLQTTRDLLVASSVALGNQQLFLEAGRDITVDAGVVLSSQGAIILTAASAGIVGNDSSGSISIQGTLQTRGNVTLTAGTGGIEIDGQLGAGNLAVATTGALGQITYEPDNSINPNGIVLTGALSGTASSVFLGSYHNNIPSISTGGFTTTGSGFVLENAAALTVGPATAGLAGGITVPFGSYIGIATNTLNLVGTAAFPALTAPGGHVQLEPSNLSGSVLLTSSAKPTGVFALTTAELASINASMLEIGDARTTARITGPITIGQTGDGPIDLTGDKFGVLMLYTDGAISQNAALKVGTLIGAASSVTLSNTLNAIGAIGDLQSASGISVATAGDVNFTGTIAASGQNVFVTAGGSLGVASGATLTAAFMSLDASGPVSLAGSIATTANLSVLAGGGGIALSGNLAIGGQLGFSTSGPVVQTAGSIAAVDLSGNAGSVLLPSRTNAIDGIGTAFQSFASGGDFTLVDSHALVVGNSGGTPGLPSGLSVGTGHTITLFTNSLTIAGTGTGEISMSALGGTIEISPFTGSNPIELTAGAKTAGALSLTTAELARTQAVALQLGVADLATGVLPTGAVTIATDGNIVDLGVDSYQTLVFLTDGAVTQNGALGVTTVAGRAGSLSLPFGNATSSNFIQNLAGFTTSAGDIALHTSSGLTVSGTVSANGGAGNVTLSSEGTTNATDQGRAVSMLLTGTIQGATVRLDSTNGTPTSSGGISEQGGVVTAATLSASGLFGEFTAANTVANLGASTTSEELSLTTGGPLQITGNVASTGLTLNAAGITQAAGTVIAATEFDGSSTADTVLANTGNLIVSVGGFTQNAGNLTLVTASPTLGFGFGVVSATTGSLTFVADAVAREFAGASVRANASLSNIVALQGTVTFAPFTAARRIELIGNASTADPNSLSLSQSFLDLVSAQTLRLGLPAATTGAVNIGNAGETITLTGLAGTLDFETAGPVTEGNGGTAALIVSRLIGNTGAVTLGGGNNIDNIGSYTASGAFELTDTVILAIGGPVVSPVSVQIQTSQAINVEGDVQSPNITLNAQGGALTQMSGLIAASGTLGLDAAGPVTQFAGASITAGTLTGNSTALQLVATTNSINAISNLSTGAATIVDATGLTLAGSDFFGDTALTVSTGGLQVSGFAGFGNLALNVAGAVTETAGGTLAATSISGTAASLGLPVAQIGTLGDFATAGDYSIGNLQPLTLAGNITAASIELSSTDSNSEGGPIPSPITQISGALTAGSISIQSSDSLTQTAGSITATGAVTLSSNGPLALAGLVSGASVGLTAIDKVTNSGGTSQTNFGVVTQTTGAITAGVLTGSADSFSLPSTGNGIGTLGNLFATGSFTLVDSGPLIVTGPVSANDASLTLISGSLTIPGSLSVNNLFVSVPGSVTGGSGVNVFGTLSGTAGSLGFGGGVNVGTLGRFTSTNGLSLANLGPLSVVGPVQDGVAVTLSSGGGMTLSGNIFAPVIDVTASTGFAQGDGGSFVLPGTISQTAGTLTATNGIALTASDVFTQSAGAVINGGSGAVTISDEGPLSLAGTVSGGAVGLTAIDRPPDAAFGLPLLPGTIAQTGGALIAATLTTSSTSTTSLNGGNNAVTALANAGSVGGFSLTDGQGLTVTGSVTDTASIALSVTGDLGLSGVLTAPAVTLASTGNIGQSAGSVQATTLTADGATVALGATANQVGTLDASAATGDFSLADSVPLTIGGGITAGTGHTLTIADDAPVFGPTGQLVAAAGHVILEANTVGGGLTVGGSGLPVTAQLLTIGAAGGGPVTIVGRLDASGATVLDLESAGAITESSGGVIVAGTLTGNGGSATLDQANQIAVLGTFATAASFNLVDSQGLTVSGAVAAATGDVTVAAQTLTLSGAVTGGNVALSATNSDLTQTAGAVTAAGTLTLTATGVITQKGGTYAAGVLTGSSGGTTSLTDTGNAVATLASFGSTGGFSLADGSALTVAGPVTDATAITLSTPNALTLSGALSTGALSLSAGGPIDQTGGAIVAQNLTGSGAGVALTQTGNQIGTLLGFASTGDFSLTDGIAINIAGAVSAGTGQTLTLTDDAPTFAAGGSLAAPGGTVALREYTAGRGITLGNGAGLTLQSSITAATLSLGSPVGGPITITGAFNLTSVGTLDLESAVAITETGNGAIQVATLTGNGGSAGLGGANAIATLGRFTTAGAFTLADGQSLTVAGPLGADTINLSVAGDLTLAGAVTAPTGVSLTATGAVDQTGGTIGTGSLTGSAASASFGSAGNAIATLAGFATTGDFSLTDGTSLTVSAPVDPNTINLTVTGDLAIDSSVTATTVVLDATGAITEGPGGQVVAGTLTGTGGSAALGGANQVATLAAFTTAGAFGLFDTQALAVSGPVVATAGDVAISASALTLSGTVGGTAVSLTSTAGDLTQTGGAVTAGTLTLTAAGAIAQSGGSLSATVLTGSSGGATALNGTGNAITTLADFSGTGGFSLTDAQSLSLSGTLTAPTANLVVTGDLSQSAGSLQVATLTGSAATVALGSAANQVGTLGGSNASGGFALTDSGSLAVTGPLSAGDTSLTLISGNLSVPGSLFVNNLIVSVPGSVTGGSGVNVAGTLSGTAGSLGFGGGVHVATLGDFASTNGLSLAALGPLSVVGPVQDGVGVTLSSRGGLTLSGNITAPVIDATATTVVFVGDRSVVLPGTIDQTAGTLTATKAVTLTANDVFTQNAGAVIDGGAVAISDEGPSSLAGTVSGGAVVLTAIDRPADARFGLPLLPGTIGQTGGALIATTLSGSSTSTTSLTSAGNAVATLAGFGSAGGFSLADGTALTVTGPVTDATSVSLSTPDALTLAGTITTGTLGLTGGPIDQTGGAIVAQNLTGSGAGVALTQAGNQIGTLLGFASTGDFSLADGIAVSIAGAVSAGTGQTLTLTDDAPTFAAGGSLAAPGGTVALREYTAGRGITLGNGSGLTLQSSITAVTLSLGSPVGGPITITGAFNLTSVGTLDLESAGVITETGNGAIQVATLTGNGGSAELGGANAIATLGGFTTAGGFTLADGQSLTVAGPLSAARVSLSITGDLALAGPVTAPDGVSLIATGAITQPGGAIDTASLTGSAASASFGSAGNAITTLAGFATTGGFTLVDGSGLMVTAPVGATTVALTVTGDLAIDSSVTGTTVALAATGAIGEGPGGQIAAGTLTGTGGSAALGGANLIGTLGGFATRTGFSVANGQSLTVTGPLTDGTAIALTAAGPITLDGSVVAPAVTVSTTSGDITQTGGSVSGAGSVALKSAGAITLAGTLTASALSVGAPGVVSQTGGTITATTLGGSAGSIDLGQNGAANIASLENLSAATSLALTDLAPLQMTGTVAAPIITLSVPGTLTLTGGAILTNGPSVLRVTPGADGRATLRQTGTTTVAPLDGGRATVAFDLPATGGSVTLNDLNAPAGDLTFSLGSGNASGVLFANNLTVIGSGGSVRFTGAVQSRFDTVAAQLSRIDPRVSPLYTFNGCNIAAQFCTNNTAVLTTTEAAIASLLRPDILTLDQLDLSVTRDRDDPTLLLPNISNQDY